MSAQQHNCLNCGHILIGKFCSNCGQKSDTHRITLKHFITHDLIHGVWHLEKGIYFTIKESIFRTGKAATDYISGKRIIYYNVFYLSLLMLGLNLLVLHYFLAYTGMELKTSNGMNEVGGFLKSNTKVFILLFIPLISFSGYIIFRKNKLNFAEHTIIAGFLFCGMVFISLVQNLLSLFPTAIKNILDYSIIPLLSYIQVLLPAWTYYKALSAKYTRLGFVWRIVLMYIIVLIFYLLVVISILFIYKYIKTGNFEIDGNFYFQN